MRTDVVRRLQSGDLADAQVVDGVALLYPEERTCGVADKVIAPVISSGYSSLL